MKTIVALVSLALAGCASTAPSAWTQPSQRYVLKNGDILLVDADGGMRMFDVTGGRVMMKDGVPMQLSDGGVIVMKENVVWKSLRTQGSMGPRK